MVVTVTSSKKEQLNCDAVGRIHGALDPSPPPPSIARCSVFRETNEAVKPTEQRNKNDKRRGCRSHFVREKMRGHSCSVLSYTLRPVRQRRMV